MNTEFVPSSFAVPTQYAGDGFRLEPLGPEHNERDHEAWMSSIDHIRATPGFEDRSWPSPMSPEDSRRDLVEHAQEFRDRVGFTCSILDEDEVIGCLYIYPSPADGYDAEVRSWVTASRAEMDTVVWLSLSTWLTPGWAFRHLDYAARG